MNVNIVKVNDNEDAVVFDFKKENKKCRVCKTEELVGGEIDFGICDLCNN
jgi:hypothetical protein